MSVEKLKIFSLNVEGLNDQEKQDKLVHLLNDSQIDIAFLQETHWAKKKLQAYDGTVYFTPTKKNKGAAILISNRFAWKQIGDEVVDSDGRSVAVHIDVSGEKLSLCSVFGPSNGEKHRNLFMDKGLEFVQNTRNSESPLIIGCDVCIPKCENPEKNYRNVSVDELLSMKIDHAGKVENNAEATKKERRKWIRLQQIVLDQGLQSEDKSEQIKTDLSAHAAVVETVALSTPRATSDEQSGECGDGGTDQQVETGTEDPMMMVVQMLREIHTGQQETNQLIRKLLKNKQKS